MAIMNITYRKISYRPFYTFTALLLFLVACQSQNNDTEESVSRTSITTATAEYRDLSHRFQTSAEVVPYQRIYVASRISGLVEEVHFEEGDAVNKGDLMARIDTRLDQNELERAKISLEESRAQFERTEELFRNNAVSQAEYLADKHQFQLAESEVRRLELLIDYGSIRAPKDALVTARNVEIGNSVSENQPLFEVIDAENLVIRPGVSEMYLQGLEVGQTVDVTMDAHGDYLFTSKIRRIFPDADADSRLFLVELELEPEPDDPPVRPGYLARLTFVTDAHEPLITVPNEAVRPYNDEMIVFRYDSDNEVVNQQSVEVGIQRDGRAQILSGLQEDDEVAASNIDALEDQTPVQVVGTFRRTGFRD